MKDLPSWKASKPSDLVDGRKLPNLFLLGKLYSYKSCSRSIFFAHFFDLLFGITITPVITFKSNLGHNRSCASKKKAFPSLRTSNSTVAETLFSSIRTTNCSWVVAYRLVSQCFLLVHHHDRPLTSFKQLADLPCSKRDHSYSPTHILDRIHHPQLILASISVATAATITTSSEHHVVQNKFHGLLLSLSWVHVAVVPVVIVDIPGVPIGLRRGL